MGIHLRLGGYDWGIIFTWDSLQPSTPAPGSSKQGGQKELGGTWRASNTRRRRRGVRGAEGVKGVGNGDGVSPSPAD